jgi:hypothetical protein
VAVLGVSAAGTTATAVAKPTMAASCALQPWTFYGSGNSSAVVTKPWDSCSDINVNPQYSKTFQTYGKWSGYWHGGPYIYCGAGHYTVTWQAFTPGDQSYTVLRTSGQTNATIMY